MPLSTVLKRKLYYLLLLRIVFASCLREGLDSDRRSIVSTFSQIVGPLSLMAGITFAAYTHHLWFFNFVFTWRVAACLLFVYGSLAFVCV